MSSNRTRESQTVLNASKILSQTDLVINDVIFRLMSRIENRQAYFEKMVTKYVDVSNKHNKSIYDKLLECESLARTRYHRLDTFITTEHTLQTLNKTWIEKVKREVALWPKRADHFEQLFGFYPVQKKVKIESDVAFFFSLLEESSKTKTIAMSDARLKLMLSEALVDRWYTIFSTLTVDSVHYKNVFEKGSSCFRNYIKMVEDLVKSCEYGSVRKGKGKECFQYFAVIEEGGKTGRLHIHVLMKMKNICDMIDPNIGNDLPTKREIKRLTSLWKYGFSTHIAIRYSTNDPFGVLKWRWPCTDNGVPIDCSMVAKVAGYMSKYLLKSQRVVVIEEVVSWRSRLSRNMGQLKIIKCISHLNSKQLFALVALRKYPVKVLLYGFPIPSQLIRRLAVKEFVQRIRTEEELMYRGDPLNTLRQSLRPKSSILSELLKSTTPKNLDLKWQSIGDLMTQVLANPVIYDGLEMDFYSANIRFATEFPAFSFLSEVSGGDIKWREDK